MSYVIQFQMHKALCLKAGQYDPNDPAKPLYKCDIDQSTEAGNALALVYYFNMHFVVWHEI